MLTILPSTFVAIVETGSITGAADVLGLAKSAVSQNLKRLEAQLGVRLAVRTTRTLTLTPAGDRYYQRCKELLSLSQQARTEMEAFGAEPSGPITITAPHALVAPIVAPALAGLLLKWPKLAPRIIAADERLDLIEQGIDLAVTVGELPDSGLHARRIGSLRDVLCVSPLLLEGAPAIADPTFPDWANQLPYIAHSREGAQIEHSVNLQGSGSDKRLSFVPTTRSNTVEAIVAVARSGLGVAYLPNLAIQGDLDAGTLVELCSTTKSKVKPITAVHPYGKLVPRSVHDMIATMLSQFQEAA